MSNSLQFKSALLLLRAISHELRKSMPKKSIKENQTMVYIMDQFRKHDMTERRVCRADNELQFLAETYLCYLNSTRNYQFIYKKFYGKGEKSISEAAKTVGLELPKNDRK